MMTTTKGYKREISFFIINQAAPLGWADGLADDDGLCLFYECIFPGDGGLSFYLWNEKLVVVVDIVGYGFLSSNFGGGPINSDATAELQSPLARNARWKETRIQ